MELRKLLFCYPSYVRFLCCFSFLYQSFSLSSLWFEKRHSSTEYDRLLLTFLCNLLTFFFVKRKLTQPNFGMKMVNLFSLTPPTAFFFPATTPTHTHTHAHTRPGSALPPPPHLFLLEWGRRENPHHVFLSFLVFYSPRLLLKNSSSSSPSSFGKLFFSAASGTPPDIHRTRP